MVAEAIAKLGAVYVTFRIHAAADFIERRAVECQIELVRLVEQLVNSIERPCLGRAYRKAQLHGSGEYRRTWLHVEDAIDGIKSVMDHGNINEIYNLACPASPIHYQDNPVHTTKTGVLGAINMLGLAKRTGAKILQASTSEVYGDPEVHPQPESYWGRVNPNGIRACYDEGKRCAETLFFDYRRQHNLNIKVARIFNTYGPNMHPNDGRVVSNFIIQALQNKPITVYGDGSQTRSFCYVDDLIEAFIKLMATSDDFTGPINTGNPDEYSVLELAEKIIQMVGSRSVIDRKPLPQDDPAQRRPDITLAKEKLQWEPKVTLEEGLKKTIKYFKNII